MLSPEIANHVQTAVLRFLLTLLVHSLPVGLWRRESPRVMDPEMLREECKRMLDLRVMWEKFIPPSIPNRERARLALSAEIGSHHDLILDFKDIGSAPYISREALRSSLERFLKFDSVEIQAPSNTETQECGQQDEPIYLI